jgi:lipoyl(octanoyl) transferase
MATGTQKAIRVKRLPGLIPYRDALDLQLKTRQAVESGRAPCTLLLLEHTPTITLGRNAEESNLLRSRDAFAELGIDVLETDRGGDVTYHGPGQLVGYPILNLSEWKESVGWYLRTLEESIIATLRRFDLNSERTEGMTGVWVDGAKVAAIGIGLRNWVTYHGMALNVDPNMNHFALIVPCGLQKPVTSFRALLGEKSPTLESAADTFTDAFLETFESSRID